MVDPKLQIKVRSNAKVSHIIIYLSIYLYICLSHLLSILLSYHLSIHPYFYLSIYLSLYPGEKCTPGDQSGCGDGAPATQAKLTFPKGVAVSLDKTVFLTDGKHLRMIDQNGVISTLIGKKVDR